MIQKYRLMKRKFLYISNFKNCNFPRTQVKQKNPASLLQTKCKSRHFTLCLAIFNSGSGIQVTIERNTGNCKCKRRESTKNFPARGRKKNKVKLSLAYFPWRWADVPGFPEMENIAIRRIID